MIWQVFLGLLGCSHDVWLWYWHFHRGQNNVLFQRWLGESNKIIHIKLLDSVWHMVFNKYVLNPVLFCRQKIVLRRSPSKEGIVTQELELQSAESFQLSASYGPPQKTASGSLYPPWDSLSPETERWVYSLSHSGLMWDIVTSSSLDWLSLGQAHMAVNLFSL